MKSIVEISERNPARCYIDDSPFNEVAYTSIEMLETTMRDLNRCGENLNEYTPVGCNEFVSRFHQIKRELIDEFMELTKVETK